MFMKLCQFFITTSTTVPEMIFCCFWLLPEIHQDYLGIDGKLYHLHSFILLLKEKAAVVPGRESLRLCGHLGGENFCLQAA